MTYQKLRTMEPLLFSHQDVANNLKIKLSSAKLVCHRYWKKGFFIRLKRDVYILVERYSHLSTEQSFQIANRLQIPSYISLTTALSYYDCTTQLQPGYIESIAQKRPWERYIEPINFSYTKISKKYYNEFNREKGFFIAKPEKALCDALYLTSLGRYSFDLSALEYSKINLKQVKEILKSYPVNTFKLWEQNAKP